MAEFVFTPKPSLAVVKPQPGKIIPVPRAGLVTKIALTSGVIAQPGYVFTAEYLAIIAKATGLGYTLPSVANQQKQDTFLAALKTAGIWTHLDALRVYKYANNLQFAAIDWVNPNATLSSNVNSPGFSDSSGCFGNGASSYIDLKITLSGLVNYSLNNSASFIYVPFGITNPGVGTTCILGVYTGGGASRLQNGILSNGGTYVTVNDASGVINGIHNSAGLHLVKRVDSANITLIENGASFPTARASSSIPALSPFLLAYNLSGGSTFYAQPADKVTLVGISDGLAGLESALKTATDNFYAS